MQTAYAIANTGVAIRITGVNIRATVSKSTAGPN